MSAQNYYAQRQARNRRQVDVGLMLELVRAQRREQPRLGVRKLYHLVGPELRKAGAKMGRDRFFEELKKAGMLVAKRRPTWPKTTHFNPRLPVFKNLLKGRKIRGPNQVWVADITYIRTRECFLYLALVTDYWSRKIVGDSLADSLETELSVRALQRGLKRLKKGQQPIHHSDRGSQYASHVFVEATKRAGLRMSMTEKNHSAENALAERINGILKQEYFLDEEFATRHEAHLACAHAIELYNTRRPHTSLKMKTPQEVYDQDG